MMDIFENQFVDMDSIVGTKLEVVEEFRSPFSSPKKKDRSPLRDGSITKEEYRRQRKDERQRITDERERREKEAPTPYQLLQVKTAVGRFPTINYVSPFSQEEIMAGKRCLQNHFKRPPEVEQAMRVQFEAATATKTRRGKAFAISVSNLSPTRVEEEVNQLNQPSMSALEGQGSQDAQEEEMKEEVTPKSRAAGGVWLHSNDFPHSFTNVIVYHNMSKYQNRILHTDVWSNVEEPYTADEKDTYLKLELDDEAFAKYKEDQGLDPELPLEEMHRIQSLEKNLEDMPNVFPGETFHKTYSPDKLVIAFAPHPTKGPYDVLPRYMCRLQTVDLDPSIKGIDQSFLKYMEGIMFRLTGDLANQKTIWFKPQVVAPQGYSLWCASNFRTITAVTKAEYMQNCLNYQTKNYTLDYLPLQEGRNHLFAKYDFKVTSEDCTFNLNFNCTDRYLLDYMRIKIMEKTDVDGSTTKTFNNMMCLENMKFPVNAEGYTLIIEGAMPYNTTEGTITLDMMTNEEGFELQEIVGCEPIEYTDTYAPSKYGIIFKEKIFTSPTEQTLASINVRLMQNGIPMSTTGLLKYFRL